MLLRLLLLLLLLLLFLVVLQVSLVLHLCCIGVALVSFRRRKGCRRHALKQVQAALLHPGSMLPAPAVNETTRLHVSTVTLVRMVVVVVVVVVVVMMMMPVMKTAFIYSELKTKYAFIQ